MIALSFGFSHFERKERNCACAAKPLMFSGNRDRHVAMLDGGQSSGNSGIVADILASMPYWMTSHAPGKYVRKDRT